MTMRTERASRAVLVVAAIVAALVLAMGTGTASALTFRITLGNKQVIAAATYELLDETRQHTLKVTVTATAGDNLVAIQVGQVLPSATVEILSNALEVVATYSLSSPQVTSVQVSGDAATSMVTQHIVMSGKAVTMTVGP